MTSNQALIYLNLRAESTSVDSPQDGRYNGLVDKEKGHKEELKKFAREVGLDLFGVADVTAARNDFLLDKSLRDRFNRGLSMGKKLVSPVLEEIIDRPTLLYFHHYRQLNFFLDRAALLFASFIQERGFRALPIAASQIVDWQKQLAHLSHKKVGALAGLGWIGRNNLLVNPELGSQFRLVTVLTDMPVEPDKALEFNCGECFDCLPCCPAGAIKAAREDFDHILCYEKLKAFRNSGIVNQHICGVCVRACGGRSGV